MAYSASLRSAGSSSSIKSSCSNASSPSDTSQSSSSIEQVSTVYSSPWPELRLKSDTPSVWDAICNPPNELLAETPFTREERDALPALTDALSGDTWTYKELRDWTTLLAFGLTERIGRKLDQRIFLCMPSSALSMVLYLAVIKAGGIAVLCNPGYTEAELSHALHLTEPHIVIGPRTLCKRIFDHYSISHEAPPSFVATDPDGSIDDDYTNFWQLSNPISMSMAQEYFAKKYSLYHHDWTKTATMAFSSGTSGMPKAVELSHKALVSLYLAAKPTGCYDMSRQERSFIPIPTYHVGGLAFWLQTCIKGDHSIFFENNPFSLETFADVCIEWKIQRLIMVPTILQGLLKKGLAEKMGQAGHLTYVLIGAAPLGSWLQEKGGEALGVRLVQGYGMTETAGGIIRSSPRLACKAGSIGTLGAGNLARLIDEQGNDNKDSSIPGELLLRGDSIMNGYFRNEMESRRTIDEDGWLHTGDQAYIDSDTGDIFIIDRIKELIKYRGCQVAPAELEALLLSNEHVLEAAVVAVKGLDAVEELPCAYIVARIHPSVELGNDLHALVNTSLSNYKNYKRLRGGIQFVTSLPKTGSNKIQRSVLHTWAMQRQSTDLMKGSLYVPYNALL